MYKRWPPKQTLSALGNAVNTTSQSFRTPVFNCEDQDRVFEGAFDTLKQAIEERVFPCASVAVTHSGRLVISKALGRFTYDANSPEVKPETVFDLASVSKVIATTS